MDPRIEFERPHALELAAGSRSFRLREMYWDGTHKIGSEEMRIAGSCEGTLVGYAKDFAALLEASEPCVHRDELIVGCGLAVADEGSDLDLGFHDRHFPPGHQTILSLGLAGVRDWARGRLEQESDPDKRDFLEAVALAYDAACRYVQRYARYVGELAAHEVDAHRRGELERIAAVCDELATGRPSSFNAALQLVQFTRVFGGSGCIGRFDQWMYPFFRRDISAGAISSEEAMELLECFFIKLNQMTIKRPSPHPPGTYIYPRNDTLRNITLAGQTPDGRDACNELTYMCLRAAAKLMLPEPKLNVRFFPGSPRPLLRACCRVLAKGANVLAIFNDEVAVPALRTLGIPLEEARDYCNNGCAELIIGGRTFMRFKVHDALAALRETVLHAETEPFSTFRDVMQDFKTRLLRFIPYAPPGDGVITFPYFAASLDDCLEKASPAGVRYSIWGSILGEVGNAADGLAAIDQFIYRDGVLTWADLVCAIKADFEGQEPLRQMLRNRAPKYGNDQDAVDAIAQEIAEYFCDSVHERACNQAGYGPKQAAGFMLFGIDRKNELPATPDGRRAGEPVANSLSPAVGMDRSGPTAIVKSASKIDLSKASFGSVLDIALHSSIVHDQERFDKFVALIDCFLKLPSTATLQVNIIDRATLLKARADPGASQYRTLIVRVWGFSAVFVELSPALQEHVLMRTEHTW